MFRCAALDSNRGVASPALAHAKRLQLHRFIERIKSL